MLTHARLLIRDSRYKVDFARPSTSSSTSAPWDVRSFFDVFISPSSPGSLAVSPIQTTARYSHEVDNNGPHALHGNTIYTSPCVDAAPHTTGSSSCADIIVIMDRKKKQEHHHYHYDVYVCLGLNNAQSPNR